MRIKSKQAMGDGTYVVKEATSEGVITHTFQNVDDTRAFMADGTLPKKAPKKVTKTKGTLKDFSR